jgi:hypothetical protein
MRDDVRRNSVDLDLDIVHHPCQRMLASLCVVRNVCFGVKWLAGSKCQSGNSQWVPGDNLICPESSDVICGDEGLFECFRK